MERIIKFCKFFIVFLLIIIGMDKVSAEAYNGKLYDVYHPDSGFTVFAAESNGWMDYNSWMIKSSIDNRIYYCIDPAIALGEAPPGSFNYITGANNIIGKSSLAKAKYDKVRLLAYYGYGYKNSSVDHTSEKWYGITQVMIWRVMRPDLTWTFKENRAAVPDKNLYKEEVAEMNKLVSNHGKVASFKDKEIKLLLGESMTLVDTNKVLSNFSRVNSLKYVDAKTTDNKLTITATKTGKEAIKYSFMNGIINPVALLTSTTYQDIFVRGMPEDLPYFQVKVEVTGGILTLQKVDGTTDKAAPQGEATLKGAVYEIYDSENKLVSKVTTDENGAAKISLDYGNYTLKEVKAPKGYKLDEKTYEFAITKDKNEISLKVADKVITGKVLITKTKGGSGEKYVPEENASFDILNSKGEVINKVETNKKGLAIIALPFGKYTIHQTSGAENYLPAADQVVNIKEDKIYEINIKNKKLSKLEFTKTDFSTSKPVPNTLIEIYSSGDELIFSGLTDNQGKIVLENLAIGKYYILEKEAPKYYRLNEEKMWFEVKENGQVIKATMSNERKKGNLIFTKIDAETGKKLSNALIKIVFDETNKVIFQGKTNQKGMIKLDNIDAGKYCIYEQEAPQGYELNKKPICFTIDREGETIKTNMTNKKLTQKVVIPNTGKNEINVIAALGAIMICCGLIYMIYEKRKK